MREQTPIETRDYLMYQFVACLKENKVRRWTLKAFSREKSCSRSTIYAHFPAGMPELMNTSICHELLNPIKELIEADQWQKAISFYFCYLEENHFAALSAYRSVSPQTSRKHLNDMADQLLTCYLKTKKIKITKEKSCEKELYANALANLAISWIESDLKSRTAAELVDTVKSGIKSFGNRLEQ